MQLGEKTKALIFAPLVGPVIYYIGATFFSPGTATGIEGFIGGLIFIFAFTAPISYLATLTIGMLAVAILNKLNILSIASLSITGATLGMFVFVAVMYAFTDGKVDFGGNELLMFCVVGAAMGFGIAFVYGKISGITSKASRRAKGARLL